MPDSERDANGVRYYSTQRLRDQEAVLLILRQRHLTLLASFVHYSFTHPEERFWQALRNWSEASALLWTRGGQPVDTYYCERRNPAVYAGEEE